MDPRIRPATAADLAAVEALVASAYGHYVARIGRAPGPMLDDYAAQIAAGRVHVLVQSGTVRGLVVLIAQADSMLLDNVAVDPAMQGRGHGRLLLEFAEEFARAAGCVAVTLYTHEMMTENQALYARIGYRETHRGIGGDNFSRVFMRKPLT